MTKGHKNFGAAGLHDFREKIKIKKNMNAREWLSFDIPTAKVTLHKMNFECMYSRQLKKKCDNICVTSCKNQNLYV